MASFRKLYHWSLQQAEKPYAAWLLFFMAFVEPWLFPMPPDTFLIPMCLARKVNAFKLAAFATAGSVLGALVGYAVGALAMATLGQWVVTTYHLENAFEHFHHAFNRYGALIILAKGLTPIPFILVTIASGVTHLNLAVFVVSCVITRGARFFLEATLLHHYGDPIRVFLEKHLTWIGLAVLALIVGGFWFVVRA
ncbi:MAG TPA: YqaA family protein [Alphaproteobacteria bacterium]|nr:YqaA family protein [Alphaproteobacteria bacterium]